MIINGIELAVGLRVKFSTNNVHDPNVYSGTVQAIDMSYRVARAYGDLAAYHDGYTPVGEEQKPELDEMNYFIIALETTEMLKVFAADWIDIASMEAIDPGIRAIFTVYNIPEEEVSTILQLLRAQGYTVRQTA